MSDFEKKYRGRVESAFIFVFLLVLLFSAEGHAHSPYAVKEGTLIVPSGEIVVKEKLYGDGIFSADPVTFQLRNRNGVVLANTPVAEHVAVFCPSVNFCWAFPYGFLSPFAMGYKLDVKKIEWNDDLLNVYLKNKGLESFHRYFDAKEEKVFRGPGQDYPEFTKKNSGFVEFPLAVFISPIAIALDRIFVLLCLLVFTTIPSVLYWLFFKRKWTQNKIFKYAIFIFGGVVIVGYSGFYFLSLLAMGFTLATPVFYMLATMVSGVVMGRLFLKKVRGVGVTG